MPMKTWDTKADFDGVYSVRLDRHKERDSKLAGLLPGNYERQTQFNASLPELDKITPEWEKILAHFKWPLRTSICIDGVGFAWSIEYLNAQGYKDIQLPVLSSVRPLPVWPQPRPPLLGGHDTDS